MILILPWIIYLIKCLHIYNIYFRNTKQHKNDLYRKSPNRNPPKPDNPNLLKYFTKTEQDIANYTKTTDFTQTDSNIGDKGLESLKILSENIKHIIIKKADKGGAIVILDEEDYIKKVLKHLNDKKSYEKVNEKEGNSLLKDLNTNITSFLETIFNHYHINKSTYKYLMPPKNPRTNLFYILPKLHKPEIPGIPIVSSVNSVTEHISMSSLQNAYNL